MLQTLGDFFTTGGFAPHGYCLLWRWDLLAMHAGSDIVIAVAYLSIPAAIWRMLVLRPGFGYRPVAFLFAAFIAACAVTHLFGLLTLWFPLYGVQGLVKLACAAISGLTAVLVWRLLPEVVTIPSPREMTDKTRELEAEMARRHDAEAALRDAHDALAAANRDLEQRVAERTADLTAANEELERFAYIASHDLRAPLRALLTIPDWLRETLVDSYGAVLPAIEDDLREMEVQSQRMDRLLSDLLTYARIGLSGDISALIDPAALIRDSADLAGRPDRFSVEIKGDLPRIFCIPAEFALIMRNLISNAVKHHDRDQGRITVSGRMAGATAIIEVRDDGPGIERKYAEKVFEMFSTLKPRDEVEGSGMGLAMVKKIMERAGGYVRLGGTEGERGAVFELAFPAAQAGIQSQGGRHVQDTSSRRQSLLGPGLQPETRNLG